MKELILNYLNSKSFHPQSADDLFKALELKDNDFINFSKALASLEEENIIYISSSNLIHLSSSLNIYLGRVKNFLKNYASISVDDELVEVPYTNLMGAFINDEVKVKINEFNKGEVIEIIKHGNSDFIATYINNEFYFNDRHVPYKIKVINPNNIKNRSYVLLKILKIHNFVLEAKYIKTIGPISSFYSIIDKTIYQSNIKKEFDDNVIADTIKAIESVNFNDPSRKRIDDLIVTIDGNEAKDFDDAISLTINENGNYYLGVHIADVSEYVKYNSITDNEAFSRGTSIYLPHLVIPMLPNMLSDDKCSLLKGTEKLAISTYMEIDNAGNVISFDIFKSIIKIKDNLHYEDVENLFNHNNSSIIDDDIKTMLYNCKNLSSIISGYFKRRGFINLSIDELEIHDHNGKISINNRHNLVSEKLIENFMILTNETTASYVYYLNLPYIYRIHDSIPTDKLKNLIEELNKLNIKPSFGFNSKISPSQISNLLNKNNDKILSPLILKAMSKACYSIDNIGHFGIASDCYCHFTSPIRRYPDLICHRLLKQYLDGNYNVNLVELTLYATNSSVCERRAIELEREIDDIYAAKYMEEHLNEPYMGIITGFIKRGIFIKLENGIEGLLSYDNMPDYYSFNEAYFFAKYKLGTTIYVKILSTNIAYGEINFAQISKKEYDKKEVNYVKTNC